MLTNEWSTTRSPVIPRVTLCDAECGCNVGFVNRWQEGVNFPWGQLAGLDEWLSQDNFIKFLWILMLCGSLSTRKDKDRTFVCLFVFWQESPWNSKGLINWPFSSWQAVYVGIIIPLRPLGDFATRTIYITRQHKVSLLYDKLLPVRYRVKCAAEVRERQGVTSEGTQVCTF